jgi:hypothetical protein
MRLTQLVVRKPTAEEWLPWAGDNHINPVIMAWVYRTPTALASYLDGDQEGNPYIFNPKKVMVGNCVTPRTLERASNVVWQRHQLDDDSLHAALQGTVGTAAATGVMSLIRHQDSLPSWERIIEKPRETKVPEEPGAVAVLVYGALERVTKETINAWVTYLNRMDPEWQCLFSIALFRNPHKQPIGFSCKQLADWFALNSDLL